MDRDSGGILPFFYIETGEKHWLKYIFPGKIIGNFDGDVLSV